MANRTLAMTAAALVIATSAMSAKPTSPEPTDYGVFRDVARQVTDYTSFTVFDDVSAAVDNGTVVLSGKVTMPFKRTDIENRVARVAGVRNVVNQIDVLPVSQFDDDLRYRIARAIYGNPNFWHYAGMVNPPIHIVVERGHVTLAGVVNNEVERVLARSLATSFGAFSVRNELRTDKEMETELESIR